MSAKWWSILVLAAIFTTGCAAQVDSLLASDEEIAAPVGPQNPSPLSGRENGLGKPVLILKIDNISNARPHEGLTAADQIYVERIEGGYSRLVAVYATELPTSVGPIRSARPTDISILRQFGSPAFGYSGAQSKLIPLLDREPFVDISNRVTGDGWYRAESPRYAPHNLMVQPARLLELAQAKREVSKAVTGFEFSRDFHPAAVKTRGISVQYPAAKTEFTWSAGNGWEVAFDGEVAIDTLTNTPHTPSTVIVQITQTTASGLKDSAGKDVPDQQLIGSGKAIMLRNGKSLEVNWQRLIDGDFPTFTYEGQQVNLKAGQIWFVYASENEVSLTLAKLSE
jgi:hypothetical protein